MPEYKYGNYEVGFKKAPKAHQFKKGQSGNPKGRVNGRKSAQGELFETLILEILSRPYRFSEKGEVKSRPYILKLIKKLEKQLQLQIYVSLANTFLLDKSANSQHENTEF